MSRLGNFDFPIPDILVFTASLGPQDLIPLPNENSILETNALQKFTPKEIDHIRETGKSRYFVKALYDIGYGVPFFPSLLTKLYTKNVIMNKYRLAWILNTALSWYFYYLKTKNDEHVHSLFLALINATKPDTAFLTIPTFCFMYRALIEESSPNEIGKYLDSLIVFFSSPFEHPEESTFILDLVLQKCTIDSTELNDDAKKLLSSLSSWLSNKTLVINPYALEGIIKTILPYVLQLNSFSLNVLRTFAEYANSNALNSVFNSLPNNFCDEIIRVEEPYYWEYNQDVVELPQSLLIDGSLAISTKNNFENGFCFDYIEFPEDFYYQNQDIQTNIYLISQILLKVPGYIMIFLIGMTTQLEYRQKDLNGKKVGANGNISMRIADFMEQLYSLTQCSGLLMASIIYTPKITLFSQTPGFKSFNTVRKRVFRILLEENRIGLDKLANRQELNDKASLKRAEEQSELLDLLLSRIMQFPLLFAEINYRLLKEKELFSYIVIKDQKFIKTLRNMLDYYRSANIVLNENQKEIEIARKSLLNVLTFLIENSETCKVLFSDQAQLLSSSQQLQTSILFMLLEIPLRSFALSLFSKAFQNSTLEIIKSVIMNFELIFANAIVKLSEENNIILIKDLINFLIEEYRKNSKIIDSFTSVLNRINEILEKIESLDSHKDLFNTIIMFLIEISESIEIPTALLANLSNAVKAIYGSNPPESVFDLFVRFVKVDPKADSLPFFSLKVPKIFKYFLKVFIHSRFNEVIKFTSDMIKFDQENAIQMSKAEVDIYLLSVIPEIDDLESVKLILNLFKQIAVIESPPLVVKQFISLLSPVNGKFSKYHELYIKTLWDLISVTYWKRPYTAKLGLGYHFDEKIDVHSLFTKGYTIMTWILIQQMSKSEVNIFSMKYQDSSFRLVLKENSLLLIYKDDTNEKISTIPGQVSPNIWTQIFINANIDKDEVTEILYNINGNEYIDNSKFNIKEIPNSIHVQFGTIIPNFDGSMEIGTSILSVLQTRQKAALLKTTTLSPIPNGIKCLAGFTPNQSQNNDNSQDKSSFTYSLTKLWKMDLLLPLFSVFEVPLFNGQTWKQGPSDTMAIFARALLTNDSVQRNFCETKKFNYIAHLISQYPSHFLNFEFYMQFFSMFLSFTQGSLQEHLFDAILANPYLWLTSDPNDHLNILMHWHTSLFPRSTTFLLRQRNFRQMLNLLTIYYWYEPTSGMCIGTPSSRRLRNVDLNVDECRKQIYNAVKIIANLSFTKSDLISIFETCQLITSDPLQVKSLLLLAEMLINEIEVCKSPNFIEKSDIFVLLELIGRNNEDISIAVIRVILALFRVKALPTQFLMNCIDSTILSLPVQILSSYFFEEMLSLYPNNPEAMTILCWYASNHSSEENLSKAVNVLLSTEPRDKIMASTTWFIWPLTFVTKLKPKDDVKAVSYIIKMCRKGIIRLLLGIELMSRVLTENVDQLKNLFYEEICIMILEGNLNISDEHMIHFLNSVFGFLFYRQKSYSNALLSLAENSPFCNEFKEISIPSTPTKQPQLHGFLFSKVFMNIDLTKEKHFIAMRFDSEGKWLDKNLSQLILQVISGKSPLYYNHALFLCVMIKHSSPQLVSNFLSTTKISKSNPIFVFVNSLIEQNYLPCPLINIEQEVLQKIFVIPPSLNDALNEVKKAFNEIMKVSEGCINAIIQPSDEQIITLARNEIAIQNRQIMIKWNQIWSEMSSERGPWSSMVSRSVLRWRRDDTACFAFCPVRLKLNKHFDDHQAASTARDCAHITIPPKTQQKEEDKSIDPDMDIKYNQGIERSIFQIHSLGHILFTSPCKVIKPKSTKKGIFTLQQKSIEIIFADYEITIIPLNDIKYAFMRTMFHKKTAIEIFTYSGTPYFINFPELPKNTSSLAVLQKIAEISPKTATIQNMPFMPYFQSLKITEKWVNGEMSNFEYLMSLNVYSGRSFLEQGQYPIFPLIVIDSKSNKLNFSDESIYRDLSKPIGALDDEVLQRLIEEMHERDLAFESKPFLYSSGPVSRLTICIFLLRMEPFTSLHIHLQSGKFDLADRQMASIPDLIDSLLHGSTDTRELIPEFYFQPEFLINMNNFDLGTRKNGKLNHVGLPPWAFTPLEYIYLNRKALESNFVSQHINEWIDLIWGDKQKGEKAEKAFNTFPPSLYEDCWDDNEQLGEKQLKAFLKMIGQIPPQLFKAPHPVKKISNPAKVPMLVPFMVDDSPIYAHYSPGIITLVMSNGTFISLKETYEGENFELVTISKKEIQLPRLVSSFQDPSTIIKSVGSKYILTYQSKTESPPLYLIDVEQIKATKVESPHNFISKIGSCSGWFLTCGREGSCHVYNVDHPKKIQFTATSYRDGITCAAVSDTFKVAIFGTRDKALSVISLTNGITIRVIDVEGVPIKVGITKTWGFIVALLSTNSVADENNEMKANMITVWTINGMHVKTVQIQFDAVGWTIFSSKRGFDYVAFALKNGSLQIAEVFDLDFTQKYSHIKPQNQEIELAGFFYSPIAESIVSIDKTGKVSYTQFIPPSW